jgi:hypothetical protein
LNQFKENTEQEIASKTPVNSNADDMLKKFSDGSFLKNKEGLEKLLPPIFLTVFLTIVYIALSHFHVKSLKEKELLKSELNELRSEYISVKSQLMKRSNQSEVAKRLELDGIKELRTPPILIENEKK